MTDNYLKSIKKEFNDFKTLGEKTFDQLNNEDINWQYNSDCNTIATIVKHLHGNMLSRWTNFLNEDGEKEWRTRDAEFENEDVDKERMLHLWNEGWDCVFNAIGLINDSNISNTITIRNQPQSVVEAVNRQLAHYASHVGQIMYVGKMRKGKEWKNLSVPKKSEHR